MTEASGAAAVQSLEERSSTEGGPDPTLDPSALSDESHGSTSQRMERLCPVKSPFVPHSRLHL